MFYGCIRNATEAETACTSKHENLWREKIQWTFVFWITEVEPGMGIDFFFFSQHKIRVAHCSHSEPPAAASGTTPPRWRQSAQQIRGRRWSVRWCIWPRHSNEGESAARHHQHETGGTPPCFEILRDSGEGESSLPYGSRILPPPPFFKKQIHSEQSSDDPSKYITKTIHFGINDFMPFLCVWKFFIRFQWCIKTVGPVVVVVMFVFRIPWVSHATRILFGFAQPQGKTMSSLLSAHLPKTNASAACC